MELQEVGSCVQVGATLIPAVNIQVEDMPGLINGEHYGVYFEILFENGSLWIVEQGAKEYEGLGLEKYVIVTEHPKWGMLQDLSQPGVRLFLYDWTEFLTLYVEKVQVIRGWRN
jgi:hypothetical protein